MKQIEKPNIDQNNLRVPDHVEAILDCGHMTVHQVLGKVSREVNASAEEVNKATDWVNTNGKILAENEEERIENENEREKAEGYRTRQFSEALNNVLLVTPEQAQAVIELTETVRENIDKVKEDADRSQANADAAQASAAMAENRALEAAASALASKESAEKTESYDRYIKDTLEEIKGSGDVPAATVAQVAENTAEINVNKESINDLALEMNNNHPKTNEKGFYVVDKNGNIGMRYNEEEGLDFAKISANAIEVLKNSGISGKSNVVSVNEAGFFVVDNKLNIGLKLDLHGKLFAKNILDFEFV